MSSGSPGDPPGFSSWFKHAWGIRRIEAVEFYLRTGWAVIGVTLVCMLFVFPAYWQDRSLFQENIMFIAIASFPALLVLAGFWTPWEITYPEVYKRLMNFSYGGDYKKFSWWHGTIFTMPMRMECRLITALIFAESLLLITAVVCLDYTEHPGLCIYMAGVTGITALFLGAIGWYRMVIVERGYLIIPDDWPE